MTENEFQECMITLGYRYHKKTKTAFNSFEGFHCLIQFGQKENRYILRLDCEPQSNQDLEGLKNTLRQYREHHKEYVVRIHYGRRQILISLRKTIDSEIDREQLRALVHFLTELCKSDQLHPLCRVCARKKKTGVYAMGKELVPICDSCIVRKRRLFERRRDLFEKKKQCMAGGLIGAVFGAMLGALIHVLLYQYFPLYGLSGALVAVLCFMGFVVTGKRANKISAVICAVIAALAFLLAEYLSVVLQTAIDIERQGGGIAVSEAIDIIRQSVEAPEGLQPYVTDTCVGIGAIVLVGFLYFLKRRYTRPTRLSKNLL